MQNVRVAFAWFLTWNASLGELCILYAYLEMLGDVL